MLQSVTVALQLRPFCCPSLFTEVSYCRNHEKYRYVLPQLQLQFKPHTDPPEHRNRRQNDLGRRRTAWNSDRVFHLAIVHWEGRIMVPTERARPLAFIRRRCGAMDKRAWTIPDRPHKENVHTCRFVFVRCALFVYVGVNRSWRAFPRSRANLFVFAQSSTAAYLKFCWLGRDSNCGGRGENRENYRPNTNSARTEVDGWLRIVNAAWLKL